MVTKSDLEKLKQINIGDTDISELKDIRQIDIDKDRPVAEKLFLFIQKAGNPYLFRVENTPVKVSFTQFAPTLQQSLEALAAREFN